MPSSLARDFLLDSDVVFLNHGSFGACPRPVFERYRRLQEDLERQPVAFLDPNGALKDRMREARGALAAEVGSSGDDLVLVQNATQALNIVAQAVPLGPGDEIVTTDHEYAACEKMWKAACLRSGARIVAVQVPLPLSDAAAFTDAILSAVGPRTRVIFLSHITSPTALVLPIDEVVRQARAKGILTIIDGAHGPGHVPLDLDRLGADVYAGNCHKWLLAPKGAGFLHVRREIQPMVEPLVVSHGWTEEGCTGSGPFGNAAFVDRIEFQGTRDPAAMLTVPAAIAYRRSEVWEDAVAASARLARATADRVAGLTGLDLLAADEFLAPQMIALPVPPCDLARLKADLLGQFGIEIPCIAWGGRHLVRLSVQGYNGEDDMERLIDALAALLPMERRPGVRT